MKNKSIFLENIQFSNTFKFYNLKSLEGGINNL